MRVANNKGFTLVEIAIVILIIGFIIAVVTGGRNLINAATVRSIITEVENFQTAVVNFQETYKALPGDMPDASTYWTLTGTNTDGNGNERIEYDTDPTVSESITAWEHLNAAEMLSLGNLVFDETDDPLPLSVGTNTAGSSTPAVGYYFDYDDAAGGMDNFLGLGTSDGTGLNDSAALNGDFGYEIDEKIDDGLPDQGRVQGNNVAGFANCHNTVDTIERYNLSADTEVCHMRFKLNTSLL